MKLKVFFLFIFLNTLISAQVPTWQWAQSAAGSGSDTGNGIAVDASGNTFVTGYFFSPTITFGAYTLTNTGNYDFFIVKYDPTGNVLWAKAAAGAFDDIGNGIATDASGNIFVTGNFTSPTLTFGTYTLSNVGGGDIFLVKYDTNGNVVWAKSEGSNNSEESNSIATDISGNVFITGQFQSSVFTIGTYTLNNSGGGDVFIVKYDGAGNPLWAVSQGGASLDIGNGISTDAIGNVFVTGYFKSATTTIGSYTLTNASPGTADMFVAKYNGSGITQWAQNSGGNFEDSGLGISTDGSGNVLVTGYYKSSTITFGTNTFTNAAVGACDVFVTKYDGAGTVIWAKSSGGNSDDMGFGIDADAAGNVYITGHMHSNAMMVGTYSLNNVSSSVGDVFVIKYNSSGTVLWAESEGGFSDDGGGSIVAGTGSNVYLTGFFVGPSITFGAYTLNAVANSDVFVAKLGSTIGENEISEWAQKNFIVYPNPSNGLFKITGAGNSEEEVLIMVYNAVGELIFSARTLQIPIDLTDKPKGVYLISINSKEGNINKKIVLN